MDVGLTVTESVESTDQVSGAVDGASVIVAGTIDSDESSGDLVLADSTPRKGRLMLSLDAPNRPEEMVCSLATQLRYRLSEVSHT